MSAAPRRSLGALGLDLRLQRRYGVAQAGLVVAVLWVLLLRLLPPEARGVAAPLVTFGDLAVVGYFFVGALVLFEKAEATLVALAVSPLRAGEFLLARTASLTLLALLLTAIVVGAGYGVPPRPHWLVLGVVLGSAVGVLAGLAVVAPFSSVSRYLLPAVPPLVVLGLPLLDAAGWLPARVVALLPSGGAWLAVDAAFGGAVDGRLAVAVAASTGWVALAAWLAARAYRRWLAVPAGAAR